MHRVLIVEQEAVLRDTFELFLTEAGYSVRTAEEPDAAMDACREMEPHVAIVCPNVWKAGAADVTTAMNELYPAMPIIAITGSMDRDSTKSDHISACVLRKPINGRELIDTVRAVLDLTEEEEGSAPETRGGQCPN